MERSKLKVKMNIKDDESQSCISFSDDSDEEPDNKRKSVVPQRKSNISYLISVGIYYCVVSQLEEIKEDGSSSERNIIPIEEEREDNMRNMNQTATFSNDPHMLDIDDGGRFLIIAKFY